MQGTITQVSWLNPHGAVFLDLKDAAGNTVNWKVELSSPNGLMKQGLAKGDLKKGDRVTVDVWLAKDGSHLADARTLLLPDGRSISCKSMWDNPLPPNIQ
jgi:hypothetical protein